MTARKSILICLALLPFLSFARSSLAEDLAVSDDEVREAIRQSLPFIAAKGESWIKQKKCVSCHRTGVMTWSFTEAARRGFTVDADKLEEWTDWSLTKSLAKREKDGTIVGAKNLDGVAQLLMGRPRNQASSNRNESYAALVKLLVEGQSDDGSWAPAGQLPGQKRSLVETTDVSTMWNALALMGIDNPSDETRSVVKKAGDRIKNAEAGKSSEWFATRLLFAAATDEPAWQTTWQKRLLSIQNDDGGWAWIVGEPSDALATGFSLYAIRRTGVASDDSAVQSARRFLIRSQRENGTWAVHGTKEKKKKNIEETAVYWGATWAAIGLLETLPTAK